MFAVHQTLCSGVAPYSISGLFVFAYSIFGYVTVSTSGLWSIEICFKHFVVVLLFMILLFFLIFFILCSFCCCVCVCVVFCCCYCCCFLGPGGGGLWSIGKTCTCMINQYNMQSLQTQSVKPMWNGVMHLVIFCNHIAGFCCFNFTEKSLCAVN